MVKEECLPEDFDFRYQFTNFCNHVRKEFKDMIRRVEIVDSGGWDKSSRLPFRNGYNIGFTGDLIWDAMMTLESLQWLVSSCFPFCKYKHFRLFLLLKAFSPQLKPIHSQL
jgi:hypothetical protein